MKPKQLQWDENGDAITAVGRYFLVHCLIVDYFYPKFQRDEYGYTRQLGNAVPESEARAACQAHFDQLWRDMTDMEEPKS